MKRSCPILLYHHVSPDRAITPAALEAQLRYLLDQGYQSLALADVLALTGGTRAFDKPAFAVTFDDGYADNWSHAFPVLEKLKVKATMYLVTARMEEHAAPRPLHAARDTQAQERAPGGFLSWSEARRMQESGLVQFGSHTQTHRHFKRQEPYQNLEQELAGSRAVIEAQLGQPCTDLAWPWGDYETDWLPLVQRLGYRSAVTTLSGANTRGTSVFELRRIGVRHSSVDWLKARLLWNEKAFLAKMFGLVYGLDKRFKVWWNKESPYSHG